jgi:acetylornithine deacetylase/succinyl-diaminopimelate desuccinylase-like protein
MPKHGDNAVLKMARFLANLETLSIEGSHPLLGQASVSANIIKGGVAINVIPDKCQVELDIRLLPDQNPDYVLQRLSSGLSTSRGRS